MRFSSIARINFSIIMLIVATILYASLIGIVPDERMLTARSRTRLCKSIATNITYLVAKHEFEQASTQLETFAACNDDLMSIGLRRVEGDLVIEVGEHSNSWRRAIDQKSDGCYVVPIENKEMRWGELELQFQPIYVGRNRYFSDSLLKLLSITTVLVGLACWLHLKRILHYLDPSRSVPPRVREALNNFAEGVVILDADDRIVLANNTFANYLYRSQEELLGVRLWDLPWLVQEEKGSERPNQLHEVMLATQLKLADENGDVRAIFSVNSSPITDERNRFQGSMLAFTDVTPLELSRAALEVTLTDLKQSKQEITKQNEELRYLATRDPLTGCINRRTFFDEFEKNWNIAVTSNVPVSVVMVDIDFFKSVNDSYGHSVGDDVLRKTGETLKQNARTSDVVCRYGGEEFSILMPGLGLDEAFEAAETIRIALGKLEFSQFSITASLGISGSMLGAENPQEMLDQADKSLYLAKRNGRNQVVRYDTVPTDLVVDESKINRIRPSQSIASDGPAIPYAAVTALLSALSFRDHQTGMHSTRVSTYAAMLAQSFLSPREVFIVEMAALLHDIGKVGVPDAILLKPGKLTPEEWRFMEKHDRIGVEIINRSFKHDGLTDIVKYHHCHFGGGRAGGQMLRGQDIPIGARILTIVDSYDAMVSDRPYRKGMQKSDAIAELRRCAGTQFDPELVERFISIIQSYKIDDHLDTESYSNDVALSIGEQVERLVESADSGDKETFVALAERLRSTAKQHGVDLVATAAEHAIQVANEDAQIERLVEESFELLSACRSMRVHVAAECRT